MISPVLSTIFFFVLCSLLKFSINTAIFKQPQYYNIPVITDNNLLQIIPVPIYRFFQPLLQGELRIIPNNSFALAILAKECGMSPTLLGP
jgi:hypothetical protein